MLSRDPPDVFYTIHKFIGGGIETSEKSVFIYFCALVVKITFELTFFSWVFFLFVFATVREKGKKWQI